MILDTRKTLPGSSALEKASVVAGSSQTTRMGLYDAILIEEYHASSAADRRGRAPLARGAAGHAGRDRGAGCRRVPGRLEAGADRLLLDNMKLAAFAERSRGCGRAESGRRRPRSVGESLSTVAGISETGVDYISVGALTHSSPALDLSLLLDPA